MAETIERIVCWACPQDDPADATGYSKKDLTAQGWRWYSFKRQGRTTGQSFVMCDACVRRYAPIWENAVTAGTGG